MWWIDPDGYYSEDKRKEDTSIPSWKEQLCAHNWKPILLLTSTVFDCSKCGLKKEDLERWKIERGEKV
jgi:hypothetical protein